MVNASNLLRFLPFGSPSQYIARRCLIVVFMALPFITGCESFSWGDDSFGQLADGSAGGGRLNPGQAAAGFKWLDLHAGRVHACGIRDDNTLWCWGRNDFGQLGNGTTTDSGAPVQVGSQTDWSKVSAGFRHTCGIRGGGQLWCWGRGISGELGDGLQTSSVVPIRVGTFSDWKEVVAATGRFTCGIRAQDDLFCWGNNSQGQLGVGDYNSRITPAGVAGAPWKGVDAAVIHACAISALNESTYCWGSNAENQIGFGLGGPFPSPRLISSIAAKQIAVAGGGTCILFKGTSSNGTSFKGRATCLGTAPRGNSTSASYVGCSPDGVGGCAEGSILLFRHIDLGNNHACGVLEDGDQGVCWGEGADGQLGQGVAVGSTKPVPVLSTKKWFRIMTGDSYSIGLENPPP